MQLSTGLDHGYGIEFNREFENGQNLMDKLEAWLESEDSPLDIIFGYGVCFLTFLYLSMQVVRALTGH